MHHVFIPRSIRLLNLDTGEPMNRVMEKPEPGLSERKDAHGNTVYVGPDTPWGMWKFLSRFVFGNPKLGKGEQGARRARRLKRLFRTAPPMTYVAVDSEIRDAVLKIFEDPSSPGPGGSSTGDWNSAITCQLTDFMDAWREATEKEPDGTPPPWYDPDPDAVVAELAIPQSSNGKEDAHA